MVKTSCFVVLGFVAHERPPWWAAGLAPAAADAVGLAGCWG